MQQVPIPTIHLFPELDRHLIALLRSLSPEDWVRSTLAKKWTVKDIAAHLLDGNIRTLCLDRDKHSLIPPQPITSYAGLVDYLNTINAEWVTAYKRVSPKVLVEQLEITGQQYTGYLATLDMFDDAIFSVAWAGEQVSKNWFHIAREYTEKFHHQLQIREAVGQPGLMTRELFYPFIDTLLQGLPHTYRNITAAKGTSVKITVSSEIGGDWYLTYNEKWELAKAPIDQVVTSVTFDPGIAWKLFTKGITATEARQRTQITGEETLAAQALQMIAIMG